MATKDYVTGISFLYTAYFYNHMFNILFFSMNINQISTENRFRSLLPIASKKNNIWHTTIYLGTTKVMFYIGKYKDH